ncbi:amino acid deaminase [Advenella sp. S44]|uniref:amino acid deaminase n=1 Tax=Advenella sp. S44 TaxID=1982755 RepID=UPI000C29AB8A|nr:amino acid deaminase [Advenella sp. S44]PJX23120.1 amino acid deaminase [Advenella sp. S44]
MSDSLAFQACTLKHFPAELGTTEHNTFAAARLNVYENAFAFPLAVLNQSALEHNVQWMQRFARDKGVSLAPHGKTTMSPELFELQLAAGAWGLTFATVFQARTGIRAGAKRIIIANQVICDADLHQLQSLLQTHPDLRIWFLVDSIEQVRYIEAWARRYRDNNQQQSLRFECLLEIGIAGQRTGCRQFEQALALARCIHQSPILALGGIECYEGNLATDTEKDKPAVDALMGRCEAVARACDQQQLFDTEEIIISAGGSAIFDLVVPGLKIELGRPVRGVLRSGCYITHDHGVYHRHLAKVQEREGLQESLLPGLEVWTMVQSVPEPGLALLTCGKRDISYDLTLPFVTGYAPIGEQARSVPQPSWQIAALNDQHAYLHFDATSPAPVVGDRVILGISHPCTTFDKWKWMPIIDENGQALSYITTRF